MAAALQSKATSGRCSTRKSGRLNAKTASSASAGLTAGSGVPGLGAPLRRATLTRVVWPGHRRCASRAENFRGLRPLAPRKVKGDKNAGIKGVKEKGVKGSSPNGSRNSCPGGWGCS